MLKKIIKFSITGGLGAVTNLVLFFLMADILHLNPTLISCSAFFIACSQNYVLNHLWTFKKESDCGLSFRLWFKFLLGSLLGFIINLIILNILLSLHFKWPFYVIPQGIGIVAGMCMNFIISDFFIFRHKTTRANVYVEN